MTSSARAMDITIPQRRIPSFATAAADVPWVPIGDGKAVKPLRFFREHRGYVGLLRVDAGVLVPWHRHTGEVHAFNLEGWRELDTGERIGPGGYVYEPPGNVDSWRAVGDEPVVVLVVVRGAVEHLDQAGAVTQRHDAASLHERYVQHCAEHGITPRELGE